MQPSLPTPAPPPDPAGDITFTRIARAVQSPIQACAQALARRFQALGLGSDTQVRQTPRGLSTFLSLIGPRGLVCIVDMTLVDGRATGQGAGASLDIRLLDAEGDVAAAGLASGLQGDSFCDTLDAPEVLAARLDQAATAVLVAALAHFDLPRPLARAP